MALIQAALDTLDFEQTLKLAQDISPYVDIIELGTPCIKYNGIRIVEAIKAYVPNCKILADLKTMDAGLYEATPFYAAGADIVTVLGAADKGTISGVIKAAEPYPRAWTQVDLLNVQDKVAAAKEAFMMGAHVIGIHTGLDQQAAGQTPFEDLRSVAYLKHPRMPLKISVAGGINKDTATLAIGAGADIIVVGAAIYGAVDPVEAAKEIRRAVDRVLNQP